MPTPTLERVQHPLQVNESKRDFTLTPEPAGLMNTVNCLQADYQI